VIHIPLLGAVTLAIGTILERFVLRKRKIDIKLYQVLEFSGIVVAMLPVIYFFWKMESAALQPINILIFLLVVAFSIVANLLVFYSMKGEKLSNLEPAKVLEPLFVILLALVLSFFFDGRLYERNFKIIIPALIAGAALIFSHVEKHHLRFNKYFIAAILGSLFFALELVLSRLILDFYSPITFYFLRSASILLLSFMLFRPKLSRIDKKIPFIALGIGIVWVINRIIIYYGYVNYGIVFTTLIIMLGPVFIYLFARLFLKEKFKWKNIIVALIIIACISYVYLTGS
jgi:drug/metabolite transporter (DMT)-like permease